jgi:hypothetical protein
MPKIIQLYSKREKTALFKNQVPGTKFLIDIENQGESAPYIK